MTPEPLSLSPTPQPEPTAPWAAATRHTATNPDDPSVVDLDALAADLLAQARSDARGKATVPVLAGPHQRALLVALTSGNGLAEHASPPAAALLVWSGRFRLHAGPREWLLGAGQLVPIPTDRHAVDCLDDGVFLLTVTPPAR